VERAQLGEEDDLFLGEGEEEKQKVFAQGRKRLAEFAAKGNRFDYMGLGEGSRRGLRRRRPFAQQGGAEEKGQHQT